MIRLLGLFILYPLLLYSNNIGLSGGKLFLQRQKMIDNLVFQLKQKGQSPVKKRLIDEFGYIGIENLIRYKEESLVPVYMDLLKFDDFYVKYKALYALRHCTNWDYKAIKPFLRSTNLYFNDMAVSTLTERNDKELIKILHKYKEKTENIYIKKSIRFAIQRINKDLKLTFPDFNYEIKKGQLTKYRYYKMGESIKGYQEKYSQIYLKNINYPVASSFLPPIIGYEKEFIFKGKRISFGVGGEKHKHVGDDCGWFREGASVYAIGNGIIRLIHHSPDWGFLMVIEHQLTNKKYICSIYGHLSKEIYLRAGDIVKKGDKIGTIGLSYSIENGGYGAHLHFGISKGPWLKSKYNYGQNLSVEYNGKIQKVNEYKLTEKGAELTFENGLKVKLQEMQDNMTDYLFWLKGYEFSKDVDRLWIDPQEFFKENRDKNED